MRMFYVINKLTGKPVVVKEGVEGYFETSVSVDDANEYNASLGYSPAMIEAAELASMFGTWSKFDSMVETFSKKAKKS